MSNIYAGLPDEAESDKESYVDSSSEELEESEEWENWSEEEEEEDDGAGVLTPRSRRKLQNELLLA